jgi:polyhydroxyalkanoate synthesis regulator phasin
MAQAKTSDRKPDEATKDQAKEQSKALLARLTDAGEDALQRIAELPGGTRALTAFNDLRNRVDDLGKKVRGIDALELRVAKLEKQVAELKKAQRKSAASRTTESRPSTPPTT